MYEKMMHDPEASNQSVADVYNAAARYLETQIWNESVHMSFANAHSSDSLLKVSVSLPEIEGRFVSLHYIRDASPDDPFQVDDNIPLFEHDEFGNCSRHTPIQVMVHDTNGIILHNYYVEYTGDDETALSIDLANQGEMPTYNPMTYIDANELAAHIDWALDPTY